MTEHEITERRTPASVIALCSCGWMHRESRRQNAFARAAKLRAAQRKHLTEARRDKHGWRIPPRSVG
jgi:hypothetical protein